MNEDVLNEIERIGIKKLYKILLGYSIFLFKGLSVQRIGFNAEDIASEAISEALNKDVIWDKEKYPDVTKHLINLLVNTYRRTYRNKEFKLKSSKELETLQEEIQDKKHKNSHTQLEEHESLEALKNLIRNEIKDENDKIYDVLEAIDAGYQNIEISKYLNIEVSEVENYKKKIRRILTKNIK